MPRTRTAVIVGDIATTHDADRLAVTGAPVVQVNTDSFGGDCHLAAHVIEKAADDLDLDAVDLLIVENVGNLVCPAEFDIGEDARVVVLSVTEGEDKPVKYPTMFRLCDAALLNKIDLLPYLDYDKGQAIDYIHQVHPDMPIFEISARTGKQPAEVGATADRLGIRLTTCQLGLFGYSPDKKIVAPAAVVEPELEQAIRAKLTGGRLACRDAWALAQAYRRTKLALSAACEALEVKIKPCQLGAF